MQRPFRLPPDAVEIVLVRHGAATEEGPIELVADQGNQPLSTLGEEQANRLAARLAPLSPAGVFVSPLERAVQTAAPLGRRLGLEPTVVDDLREVHLGEWEANHGFARRVREGDPLVRELLRRERWEVIPGAEPTEALAGRVRTGVENVATAVGGGETAVVVTHAGVIAEACRQATGSTPFAFLRSENAAVSRIIVRRSGRWHLQSFNDISHLG